MLCASVDTAILIPAACASRAFSADRSSRSGLALISKKQPFSRGAGNDPFHIKFVAGTFQQ